MNRTALKNYAPQARRAFIQAITDRAAYYGLAPDRTEPVVQKGDVAVIAGREHPRAVAGTRKQLEERIKQDGFAPTMEAIAYTWFNRLVAIRFMELHGYLEHGFRVLSHPEGKTTPEILEQAEHVALAGLKHDVVIDLKLAGNKEGELYRLLLTAQCNALHAAMPFLFERIDDETELLLPDNLLNSDSLIRKLVSEIDDDDWQQVEIIGWLYQYYIAEKQDQVIGKLVASEDIPAATQLFTPNWIVKYLTQNTLGGQWMATYPHSPLRQQMEYYIEPAPQSPEVQEQLKAITPTSLNPEELTLLDPACGSGHILVEAYDLFKAIYQERGYRAKDIPTLILHKNLFGLEIDERAAQLASFSLMMKARADDRRIFDSYAKPNILAFQDSRGMSASEIAHALNTPLSKEDVPSEYLFQEIQEDKDGLFSRKALAENAYVSHVDITSLLGLFEDAKTFGSLIQIPVHLKAKLPIIEERLNNVVKYGNLIHAPAIALKPLLSQALMLCRHFSVVETNPPYLNRKYLNQTLKKFLDEQYKPFATDVFAAFIYRCVSLTSTNGMSGFVTPYQWMFNSSYEGVRRFVIENACISSLVQLEYNAFGPACVPVCTFALQNTKNELVPGTYINLSDFKGIEVQPQKTLEAIADANCAWRFVKSLQDFKLLPSIAFAYWIDSKIANIFATHSPMSAIADARQGLSTADTGRFLRHWFEVQHSSIAFGCTTAQEASESRRKWFPHCKGGGVRRWYGNHDWVINWSGDGQELRAFSKAVIRNSGYYFRPGITWCDLTSSFFTARRLPAGFVFDTSGPALFVKEGNTLAGMLAFLNSCVFQSLIDVGVQGMHYTNGVVSSVPVDPAFHNTRVLDDEERLVALFKADWDTQETSWDFSGNQLLFTKSGCKTMASAWSNYIELSDKAHILARQLETDLNRYFIEAYDVPALDPQVQDDQITLYRPERGEDSKRFISYGIGCLMGRYSLERPGLIYAHNGNHAFVSEEYKIFPVDKDGIVPVLDTDWGIRGDAASRILEFVSAAWPKEYLEENLKFIADSLGSSSNEEPRETIRRYLATRFFKHHLSMYKNRPIYWLFSSGKQRAFQCLVYLHRYHDGTLARMRTEYVIPLQGQFVARLDQLEADKVTATSTSHRNKLQKEQTELKKQQAELLIFEEKLKHLADQKIALDLDDGVKTNYAKFGDLLAESKAVTGGKDDE